MKFLFIILNIFVLTCSVQCQIENGWKGIKVFETSRTEVEKILGKPKEDKSTVRYVTDEAIIDIIYSRKPCSDAWYGAFSLEQNIVFEYEVKLNNEIPLSVFNWQKENYKRFPDPELLSWVYYHNSKDGVAIQAGISDYKNESVVGISFYATKEQESEFSCKKN